MRQRRTTWADMRLKTSTEETFKKKLLEPSLSSDRQNVNFNKIRQDFILEEGGYEAKKR